ncbi:MAG: hypothetical protein IJ191_00305 [Treponema sp.]|nr:hypothetical protein [Treponema sp.]
MKKLYLFFIIFLILLNLSSCGNTVVGLDCDFTILKDENTPLTVGELYGLNFSPYVMIFNEKGISYEKTDPNYDETENGLVCVQYHIGIAHTVHGEKNLKESYKNKMKKFSFTIEDPSGTYETYIMNPLDNTYKEKAPCWIEYTITLKKKTP